MSSLIIARSKSFVPRRFRDLSLALCKPSTAWAADLKRWNLPLPPPSAFWRIVVMKKRGIYSKMIKCKSTGIPPPVLSFAFWSGLFCRDVNAQSINPIFVLVGVIEIRAAGGSGVSARHRGDYTYRHLNFCIRLQ